MRGVVDADVTLVTTTGPPVRLAGDAAQLAVDLRQGRDADLQVDAVIDGGDLPVPAETVGLLGSPPHGACGSSTPSGIACRWPWAAQYRTGDYVRRWTGGAGRRTPALREPWRSRGRA